MSKQAVDMIRTIDPAVEMLLAQANAEGIPTVFSRAAAMAPCPIGEVGKCCKYFHGAYPVRDHIHHRRDGNSKTTYAWDSAHLLRIDRYSHK